MDYLNKDINTLSKKELNALLPISEEAMEFLLQRRAHRPFVELNELQEIPDVDEVLIEKLRENGTFNFGPPLTGGGAERFPKPVVASRQQQQHKPISAFNDVLLGLSQLFAGLARIEYQGEKAGGKKIPASAELPELENGEHRKLSDAIVAIPRVEYGLMHAPPATPLDPPGPLGYHWHTYWVTPPPYCAYVWIVKGRVVGDKTVGSSRLAEGATGTGVLQTPTANALDKVVEDMHRANSILAQCEFQFSVCGVHVLDMNQLEDMNGANIANQLFTNDGTLYADDNANPGNVDPLSSLYISLQLHPDIQFHKNCYHIFYVYDVQKSPAESDSNAQWTSGVGGARQAREGTSLTPMAILEGGGRTIAHEAGHGLGEPHIDRPELPRRQDEPPFDPSDERDRDNLMREVPQGEHLNKFQCGKMKDFIRENRIRRGCP